MNDLIEYIKVNKVLPPIISDRISDVRNVKLPKRHLFVSLRSYAKKFFEKGIGQRLIALSGLRGVGKTTLIWQVAEEIYKNYTEEIYFISGDELQRLGYSLYDVVNVFEQHILKRRFYEIDKPFVLLLDEIHEVEKWDKDLKILYDKCKKAFILCTGSSALLLHKSPDLASRWSLLRLYPFKFTEFIQAKSWQENPYDQLFPETGLGNNLKQIIFYSKNKKELAFGIKKLSPQIIKYQNKIKTHFPKRELFNLIDEYISYHNIARFFQIENKSIVNDEIIDLLERILYKDIPQYGSSLQIEVAERLLFRLAMSDEINYQSLSKDFGRSKADIENMLNTLDKAEILNLLVPYGGIRTKTGQNKKAFFMSPSIRRALYSKMFGQKLEIALRAKLYEDIVALYLKRLMGNGFITYGQSEKGKSPDFIIGTRDKPMAIEVGTRKVTTAQIKQFQNKIRYGIVVNAKTNHPLYEDNIVLPLSWFLLM